MYVVLVFLFTVLVLSLSFPHGKINTFTYYECPYYILYYMQIITYINRDSRFEVSLVELVSK